MYARSERLSELFLQEISRLLPTVKDPGLSGFVTVTGLELSKDMKTATAYYSMLGGTPEERASTAQALERCTGYLRHELRGRLHLKTIPEIRFRYDQTPERADRVDRLLAKIEEEKHDAPPDAPPDGPGARKDRRRDK